MPRSTIRRNSTEVNEMRDVLNVALGVLVALSSVTAPRMGWAEDGDQSPYQGTVVVRPQSGYQPAPVAVPSGTVIGYKPIPNSALEAAMSGATPAPAEATPVYPSFNQGATQRQAPYVPGVGGLSPLQGASVGAPVGSAPGTAGQVQGPGQQLPMAYQFGVVGEGFYTLGRDDIIQIDVRNQPEFSGMFLIGFDGRIQYNYLGDIPIAGMTKYSRSWRSCCSATSACLS
jgi:hypothetical protein